MENNMNKMTAVKWLGIAGLSVMSLASSPQSAAADLFQCQSRDGSVRVYDRERNACGRLTADNANWTQIGNPNWNDRIDDFGNDDWTRGRAMCFYRDVGYWPVSGSLRLLPGYAGTWRNTVSSNRWRTGGC